MNEFHVAIEMGRCACPHAASDYVVNNLRQLAYDNSGMDGHGAAGDGGHHALKARAMGGGSVKS